jgi:hypothetical protein
MHENVSLIIFVECILHSELQVYAKIYISNGSLYNRIAFVLATASF